MRVLYSGDNLDILRNHIRDESVDLVYLDPPFNSQRDYYLRVQVQSGTTPKPVIAFTDTWKWDEEAYQQFLDECGNPRLRRLVLALVESLGRNEMTAYLVMMAPRLVELHRVMKRTGSIYLHCDPTASHYLKVLMDAIWGGNRFRNEIVWKRTNAHSGVKRWAPVHDVLLFYTKSNKFKWNTVYMRYKPGYVDREYPYSDERGRYRLMTLTRRAITPGNGGQTWNGIDPARDGRQWVIPRLVADVVFGQERCAEMTMQEKLDALDKAGFIVWRKRAKWPRCKLYIDTNKGVCIQDVIDDIRRIWADAKERVGYPTQKPLALLERIMQASSNEGDVVLDPFCGCGTAIVAAEKLGRTWIGIDNSHVAISLTVNRLSDMFGFVPGEHYEVVGDVPLIVPPQDAHVAMAEVSEAGKSEQLTLPF
jgi:DNA modification methylase